MMVESQAWVDKYQPKTLNDCFLPSKTRDYLNVLVQSEDLPSMFFSGPSGIGKTSTAVALVEQLDLEFMKINASLYGSIDTIRTDIQQFASTISFNGKRKVIILDEADYLSAAAQASLRGVISDFASNVSFILTANFRNKIIEPIISRLTEVNFLFDKNELPLLAKGLYGFILARLDEDGVSYEKAAVQQFLKARLSHATDIRKILIEAQRISKTGVFNNESLLLSEDSRFEELIGFIKSKNFNDMRTWVGENSDLDPSTIFRHLYDHLKNYVTPAQIPMVISIINEFQFKHAFVIDKEINMVDMIATISKSL